MEKPTASKVVNERVAERLRLAAIAGHWAAIDRIVDGFGLLTHFPDATAIGSFEGDLLAVNGTWRKSHILEAREDMHDGSKVVVREGSVYDVHLMTAADDVPDEMSEAEIGAAQLRAAGESGSASHRLVTPGFSWGGKPLADEALVPDSWPTRLAEQCGRVGDRASNLAMVIDAAIGHERMNNRMRGIAEVKKTGDLERFIEVMTEMAQWLQSELVAPLHLLPGVDKDIEDVAGDAFTSNYLVAAAPLGEKAAFARYVNSVSMNGCIIAEYIRLRAEAPLRPDGEPPTWAELAGTPERIGLAYVAPLGDQPLGPLGSFIPEHGAIIRIPAENAHGIPAGFLFCKKFRRGFSYDNQLYPLVGPDFWSHKSKVTLVFMPTVDAQPQNFTSPANFTYADYCRQNDPSRNFCAAALSTLASRAPVESRQTPAEVSKAESRLDPQEMVRNQLDQFGEKTWRFFERRRFLPKAGYADHRAIYLGQFHDLTSLTFANAGQGGDGALIKYRSVRICLEHGNPIWLLAPGLLDVLERSDLSPEWDMWEQPWPMPAMHFVLPLSGKGDSGRIITITRDDARAYTEELPFPNTEHLAAPAVPSALPRIVLKLHSGTETLFCHLQIEKNGGCRIADCDGRMPDELYQALLLAAKALAWMTYSQSSCEPSACLRKANSCVNPKKSQDELWSAPLLRLPSDLASRKLASAVEKFKRDESRGLRAHWRRGHLRNQRHGPARTLVKVIFIAPCRVGHEMAA